MLNKIDQLQLDESFHKNAKQTIKLLSHGHVRSQNHGFWERFSGRLLRSSLLGFTQACSMCVYAVSPEYLLFASQIMKMSKETICLIHMICAGAVYYFLKINRTPAI